MKSWDERCQWVSRLQVGDQVYARVVDGDQLIELIEPVDEITREGDVRIGPHYFDCNGVLVGRYVGILLPVSEAKEFRERAGK